MSVKFVCINLDRRLDRKEIIKLTCQNIPIEFRSAVDGKSLVLTDYIKELFKNNDFNWRRGVIGCALSHFNLWKELAMSSIDYYVILEDDTQFAPDFMDRFQPCFNYIKENNIWLAYLGHHDYIRNMRNPTPIDISTYPKISRLDIKTSGGGTGGYIISRQAAISAVSWFEMNGISRGIDYAMFSWMISKDIPAYVFSPKIIRNPEEDTDIQKDFSSI